MEIHGAGRGQSLESPSLRTVSYMSVCARTIWRHLKGGFPRSQPLRFSGGPRTGPRNLHFSKPHTFPGESAAAGEEAFGKTPAVRF